MMTEEKETPGPSKKILVGVIIAVVLVLGGMAAGLFALWSRMAAVGHQGARAKPMQPAAVQKIARARVRPVFLLDTFIVPLADPGQKRFLRVTLALQLSSISHKPMLEKHSAQIREAVFGILPTRSQAQVATAEGKQALRAEILAGLHAFLPASAVTDLYYTEFVVE